MTNENQGLGDLTKTLIDKVTLNKSKDCISCWQRRKKLNQLMPNVPLISEQRKYSLVDLKLPANTISFLKRIEEKIILVGGAARNPESFKDLDFVYDGYNLDDLKFVFDEKSKEDIRDSIWPHLKIINFTPSRDVIIYPFFNVRERKIKIPNVNIIPSIDYTKLNHNFKQYKEILEQKLYTINKIYGDNGIELNIKVSHSSCTPKFDTSKAELKESLESYKLFLENNSIT